MVDRFYEGMPGSQAFRQLNGLDADVKAAVVAGSEAKAEAASSAAEASAARDKAIEAWRAAAAPGESLAAISQTLHNGNVVAAFIYDTSLDSDDGAWRKRCRHTSWENEPLVPGRWMGYRPGSDAEVAASGVLVGDYYQSSSATGNFYQFGGAEVFRGNKREFPSVAGVIVEQHRVVIYDLSAPGCPMWMVFATISAGSGVLGWGGTGPVAICCAAMVNGQLYIGGNEQTGLIHVDFAADTVRVGYGGSFGYELTSSKRVADRNGPTAYWYNGNGYNIAGAQVSAVAATVLPTAPINPANGLPVPTVVVGTTTGVSVIKHDGTVVNNSDTAPYVRVGIRRDGTIIADRGLNSGGSSLYLAREVNSLTNGFVFQGGPATVGLIGASASAGMRSNGLAIGSVAGLKIVAENPSNSGRNMEAAVGSSYVTGWMPADIRGAWLADTTAESVVGANLVPNSDFSTASVAAFTNIGGCELTVAGGRLRATKNATQYYGEFYLNAGDLGLVAGKKYVFSFDYTYGSVPHSVGVYQASVGYIVQASVGTRSVSVTFSPSGAADRVGIVFAGLTDTSYAEFDNFRVQLADADRSSKGNALVIVGELSKAPVAPGAQLVSYGGFSAANYLEQPYNASLNFGTGDFYIFGWMQVGPGGYGAVFDRLSDKAASNLAVHTLSLISGSPTNIEVRVGGATASWLGAFQQTLWCFVSFRREAGVASLFVNGGKVGASVTLPDSVTNEAATSTVGAYWYGGVAQSSGFKAALVRVGSGAPSDEQIAQIYRDELALFQPGSQCTIAGSTPAITALAYDGSTDLLHIGTGWGRSSFKGLQRIESAQDGYLTAISACEGGVIAGGGSVALYSQPPITIRDEIRRKNLARRMQTKELVDFDFDSVSGQTSFPLPIGFVPNQVFVAGSARRCGATKDYTVAYDGYRHTVNFAVSPGTSWIRITANRSY